jgi:hypothetical protein
MSLRGLVVEQSGALFPLVSKPQPEANPGYEEIASSLRSPQ